MADPIHDPDADRDFRTYIPETLWTEYYTSLGKLMHGFAKAEDSLNNLIGMYVEKHVFSDKYYKTKSKTPGEWTADELLASQRDVSLSIRRK